MIAEKMKALVAGSSVIRAMFEEGKKMAQEVGAENVFDFSLGNPVTPAPEKVAETIGQILATKDSMEVHGYMSNSGYPQVRAKIAASLNERFGLDLDEEAILMTVGASGGLNVILKTLINPGDEVLTLTPYFGEYRNYVSNFDGVLVEVPAAAPSFQPDLERLENAVNERTKAMIINSPNNPTGVVYTEETTKGLCAMLERKEKELGTSIYLISDEPYRELAYDGVEVPYLTKYYHNAIVGYSFSKSLSLPGERIGYLVMPASLDDAQQIRAGANVANRILGFVNAPSLMQLVVGECLDEKTDLDFYDRNRKALTEGLSKCGYTFTNPDGAFYLWMQAPGGDDKAFSQAAKKYHILVVPGSSFGYPGYVRIAYCVSPQTIAGSMAGFKALAEEYSL